MKIGFLISEYPGQTHSFFWREMSALRRLYDVAFQVIGTRPNAAPAAHDWLAEAPAVYLYPIALTDLPRLALALPGGLWRFVRHPGNAARLRSVRGWMTLVLAVRLWHCVRRHRIDHLHVHSLANSAMIAAVCRQIYGLPYSVTLHGPLAYFGPDQPYKWRHAEFALVITETLRRAVLQVMPNMADKITVAPMGVDTAYFAPPTKAAPPDAAPFRWFSCGRLVPGKGFDTLLCALSRLKGTHPDLPVQLAIAGEDARQGQGYRRELQALIDTAGLQADITLLGALGQNDIRDQLHAAQGFALISNEEALGVAYMEAMACGLPVIGARTGGVGELIDHGKDGFLVAPGDDAALADIMARIMQQPDLRQRTGQAARAKIQAAFSSERSAHALAAALQIPPVPQGAPK